MSIEFPCTVELLEPRTLFAAGLPRPDHVLIVVEENHSYGQILGPAMQPVPVVPNLRSTDPYIRSLARHGASFRNARAETHPSQPNYLALFSGSTQGVTSDAVPRRPFTAPNLGGELIAAGLRLARDSRPMAPGRFHGR